MKFYLEDYSAGVDKMKEDLKTHMVPIAPLAPNEFQSRLRQVTLATMDKARTNKVQLPRTFYMGFEEFASSLPTTAAAPLLGQQLSQIALLMNILIDARVDGVTALKRTKLPEEGGAVSPTPPPAATAKTAPVPAAPKVFERNVVDLTFVATQPAARKVLNQIASSSQQFYIIRTLYVKNEKDKGPTREAVDLARAQEKLQQPAQWAFRERTGLFVPEKHFIGPEGLPVTLKTSEVHPPVPNEWLETYGLPIADSDVLSQDQDSDGFN